jgi:amino acid adenylation domain-containing protein
LTIQNKDAGMGMSGSGELKMNNVEDSYPLSPMQKGMLFQSLLAPKSGVYVERVICYFRENLNTSALREAWNRVVTRYQTLRTGFRWDGLEEPMQDVYANVNLPFELHDWQSLSVATQQIRLEEFLEFDRKKGFNLAEAPLMRLSLFRLGPAYYQLVWTCAHIIIDDHSLPRVLNEVFAIYNAICQGKDLSLQQPRPYRDYINWLQRQDISKSGNFWRELLEGFQTPTPIGSFQATSHLDSENRELVEIETHVPETVMASLQDLAQENQVTLNAIVQGAWALLLSRYSGEEDIVFGEVRAGRRWAVNAGDQVGLFIHMLPLRVRVSPGKSLPTLIKEIRQLHLALREYGNTPLADIQGWSKVPRGVPLFNSIYVFDYYDLNTSMQSKGGNWENREFRTIDDNGYPITLYVSVGQELLLKLAFDRKCFDDGAIKLMLGHLKTILEGIAEDPNRSLATIPILTDGECHQILVELNDTGVNYPRDKLIHQVFEAQAKRTPDRIAVVFEGEQLTYKELDQRANQLARYLQSIGVGPETLVGIFVERSLEMVVGLYGILKAGGAYVPLDPAYPAERIAYMLEEADVPVLLTQAKLRDRLPPHKAQVVCLDTDWNNLMASQSTEKPFCKATLENLAYTIYTSGSTGKPKGVMNTHGGILNRLLWMQEAYQLTASDHVLQKTPFSFDVSVWEFFWPLMFGARLVVARPEGHKDGDYLVQTIIDQKVTTMHFVPSMLQIFLMAKDMEKCDSLRQVICSGEALPLDLQNRFFALLDAKLHNLYGPTEAAVDVTYWECQRESNLKTVPIGRPVANTQIYILDPYMQPVPIGVSGELHIGGVQVARGYLNRPELTAEKFIPDPFSNNPNARLYKTGDLARYLPDGSIEYLGRLDNQVKIRGLRIELGEIESVLSQHPTVREAVVLAREDVPDDKRLVAYIIPDQNQKPSLSELRDYINQKLPDFMVPSHFVPLDAFPLTPNQKVDRRALPAPDHAQIEKAVAYVPPKNELQQAIAGIWQELLRVPKVGMNDNFFELGGHSLLIVQACYRLREMTDRKLSITDMFRFPTINTLTEYLSQDLGTSGQVAMQEITERAKMRRAAIMRRRQVRQKVK